MTEQDQQSENVVARVERPGSDVVVRKPTDDNDLIAVNWDNGQMHPIINYIHQDSAYDLLLGLAEFYGYTLSWGDDDDV